MKLSINPQESVFYSIERNGFRIVFKGETENLIGVSCFIAELNSMTSFKAEQGGIVNLNFSEILKEKGGYDLLLYPIYKDRNEQTIGSQIMLDDNDKSVSVHIHWGKCELKAEYKENRSPRTRIICISDHKINLDYIGIEWQYKLRNTPIESAYTEYKKGFNFKKKEGWTLFLKYKESYKNLFPDKLEF